MGYRLFILKITFILLISTSKPVILNYENVIKELKSGKMQCTSYWLLQISHILDIFIFSSSEKY